MSAPTVTRREYSFGQILLGSNFFRSTQNQQDIDEVLESRRDLLDKIITENVAKEITN